MPAAVEDPSGEDQPADGRQGTAPERNEPTADGHGDGPAQDARDTELEAIRGRLARARADYDNLLKRVNRDAGLERERAKARVLEGLLPLHELCQMAARQAQAHPPGKGPESQARTEGLVEGLVLLAREFHRFLEREGLQPVGTVGEAFDGLVHEAVAEEAAEGVEAGHVSRVIQQGYKLGDKVLRFAKVAVAPAAPSD